ncbi:MAG: glycosyltransferase [Gammaproteobacteria bacterium]
MRILYLDLNIRYHNNTRNLIPSLLNIYNEVDIYGPGYSSNDELEKGVEAFYEKNGPYDFVCSNEHISVFFVEKANNFDDYMTYLNNAFYFNFEIHQKHLYNMSNFYKSVTNVTKILFLMEFDRYWFPKYREELLLELDAYIVGYGKQFAKKSEDCPYQKNEAFYKHVNNNWYNFVQKYSKVIQLIHFIDPAEFFWGDISDRPYECSVPGTGYWARKLAFENLSLSKIKMPTNFHNKIYFILSKLGIKSYSNRLMLYNYNQLFNNLIEDSKAAFTCGSGNEQPIRKFFEIPAKGTVLLCLPFHGFEEMGFQHNENCIICHPNEIVAYVEQLKREQKNAERISINGRKFIFETHSIFSRAQQLQQAFNAIINSSFVGTRWERGKFIVDEK